MTKNYDVVIVGSGLSAVTCLKYIIKKDYKFKIGIITGYKTNQQKLSKSERNFLKKNHNKISQIIMDDEIDREVLKSSIKNKTNLFFSKNKGGLAAFWGAGFFPEKATSTNEIYINNFIKENFVIYKKGECEKLKINKILARKFNFTHDQLIKIDSNFILSAKNNFSQNDIYLYNPYEEIKNLTKIHKNIDLINDKTLKFNYNYEKKLFFIYNSENKFLTSNKLLLCGGVLNTPKILYKSGYLKSKIIEIKDHKLYRVPLINPLSLVDYFLNKILLKSKSNNINEYNISSLVESYKFDRDQNDIFLGIYFFPKNFFKFNKFLNWLANNKFILFSQLYHHDPNNIDMIKIDISSDSFEHKIVRLSKLKFFDKIKILEIFLKFFLIPIPYKYSQNFGSSYHLFGSLSDYKISSLKLKGRLNSKFKIADSSTLKSIGCEPSSYKVISNALLKVKKLLD